MSRNNAYRKAEQAIKEARQSGAKELDLSAKFDAEGSEKLTELPKSLGWLTQLQALDLTGNQLTTLPEWLGRLARLQTLNLRNNQLTTLPEWLGRFAQLRTLNLRSNELTALPESGYGE